MIVYKISNTENSKIYIGITKRELSIRWNEHSYCSKNSCKKLYNAIRKYGKDKFSIEKIDEANDLKDLCKKEMYWIDFYQSNVDGYNITSGGTYFDHSEETRKLMSEKAKERIRLNGSPRLGKKLSDASRKLMSEKANNVGVNNPMFGKVHPNKGKSIIQPKAICKYCNMESSRGMISRWHNEKCKDKYVLGL